jgi:hypothetical protein
LKCSVLNYSRARRLPPPAVDLHERGAMDVLPAHHQLHNAGQAAGVREAHGAARCDVRQMCGWAIVVLCCLAAADGPSARRSAYRMWGLLRPRPARPMHRASFGAFLLDHLSSLIVPRWPLASSATQPTVERTVLLSRGRGSLPLQLLVHSRSAEPCAQEGNVAQTALWYTSSLHSLRPRLARWPQCAPRPPWSSARILAPCQCVKSLMHP